MISNFNEEAQEIMIKAKLEMLELRHPYVGTEHRREGYPRQLPKCLCDT